MLQERKNLADIIAQIEGKKSPPVHLWQPEHHGEIDIVIKIDGSWHYQGSVISRQPIVNLFAGILRRESIIDSSMQWFHTGSAANGSSGLIKRSAGYALVTPAEKLRIEVEDAPFAGVSLELFDNHSQHEQSLVVTTNIGDKVIVDQDHPIHVHYENESADPRPYVLVRDALPALLSRTVWLQMVELAAQQKCVKEGHYGIMSSGTFFALGAIA